MKSDARLLLNKKKWNRGSGSNRAEIWKSRGTIDARKILNIKRSQKSKPPVLGGSYMRIKSATALLASQIKKEISGPSAVPNKHVKLSNDGNIIITSKAKNEFQYDRQQQFGNKFELWKRPHFRNKEVDSELSRVIFPSRNRFFEQTMQHQPSTSIDDLEHTAIEDLIDVDTLPPAYVASKSVQNANLSRQTAMNQILEKKYTMVADQLSQYNNTSSSSSSKVYVSNLQSTVSRQDVMELFGDIGVIKSIEMLMPGSAHVEFFNDADAIKACDIYHNRLLDGRPMKCYLQSGSTPKKYGLSQRLGIRSIQNFDPVVTLPTPTVVNSRSRFNPRNVQFTVKLT